jgi:hypothetical protein
MNPTVFEGETQRGGLWLLDRFSRTFAIAGVLVDRQYGGGS